MGRLRNARQGTPGYSHFPADRERSNFEQLLGEALVATYSKGQPIREWRPKKGVRHEALDARVYAYAALRALVSMGWSWMPRLSGFLPRPPLFGNSRLCLE
jgi:phage terminase large subunit GpA-like protein